MLDLRDIARTFARKNGIPQNPRAMMLTDTTFWMAGPPRFPEEQTAQHLATARTGQFALSPVLQDALDTFEGRKGGVLLATSKANGEELARFKLPSSPVFDGMIAAGDRLYLAAAGGKLLCMAGAPQDACRTSLPRASKDGILCY